jgi:hypothetical protein
MNVVYCIWKNNYFIFLQEILTNIMGHKINRNVRNAIHGITSIFIILSIFQ